MREPSGYRETLEYLSEKSNGKTWLSTTEVAQLLGVHRDTVKRRFGIAKGCALPVLAKKLIEQSR